MAVDASTRKRVAWVAAILGVLAFLGSPGSAQKVVEPAIGAAARASDSVLGPLRAVTPAQRVSIVTLTLLTFLVAYPRTKTWGIIAVTVLVVGVVLGTGK